jgi:hypothetical protein
MLLSQMLVMYFMRFTQAYQIFIIGVFEPLKTLMYQDIVDHEITKSVECDSESNEEQVIHAALYTKVKKYDTGYGKDHKKDIVSFEYICIFGLVMISMKIPHQSVHHILMCHPGHAFHKKENT